MLHLLRWKKRRTRYKTVFGLEVLTELYPVTARGIFLSKRGQSGADGVCAENAEGKIYNRCTNLVNTDPLFHSAAMYSCCCLCLVELGIVCTLWKIDPIVYFIFVLPLRRCFSFPIYCGALCGGEGGNDFVNNFDPNSLANNLLRFYPLLPLLHYVYQDSLRFIFIGSTAVVYVLNNHF